MAAVQERLDTLRKRLAESHPAAFDAPLPPADTARTSTQSPFGAKAIIPVDRRSSPPSQAYSERR